MENGWWLKCFTITEHHEWISLWWSFWTDTLPLKTPPLRTSRVLFIQCMGGSHDQSTKQCLGVIAMLSSLIFLISRCSYSSTDIVRWVSRASMSPLPLLWAEDGATCSRQDSSRGDREPAQGPQEAEAESGSLPRPAGLPGYFKQFQKSLPPRFQRQQVRRGAPGAVAEADAEADGVPWA